MKSIHVLFRISALSLVAGCATSPRDLREVQVSTPIIDKIDPPSPPRPTTQAEAPLVPPNSITLPAIYRGFYVNGRLTFKLEESARVASFPPSAARFVVGDPQTGEIGYQPALLDKELAAELARSREINAKNEIALGMIMERSTQLVRSSKELQENSARLSAELSQAIAQRDELAAKLSDQPTEKPKK